MNKPPPAYTPKPSPTQPPSFSGQFGHIEPRFVLLIASIALLLLDDVPKLIMLPFVIGSYPTGSRLAISVALVIFYDGLLLQAAYSEWVTRKWCKTLLASFFILNHTFNTFSAICFGVNVAGGVFKFKTTHELTMSTNVAILLWMMLASTLATFMIMVRYKLLKELLKGKDVSRTEIA